MIKIIEPTNNCIYEKIVNDEYPDEVYGEVDIYDPSEDWMELQVDYSEFYGDTTRRFGLGGIIFKPITPSVIHVYIRDMDAEGEEHFLFSWSTDKDITPYSSDGDYEISAEFAWSLCHAIRKYF